MKKLDAWIYINGNLEGAYEMPATIPLYQQGLKNFHISWLKETSFCRPKKYPFYLPLIHLNLIPDSIIEINLQPIRRRFIFLGRRL